jgi:carbamoyltransferase
MKILGISAFYHDAAAAIVQDGVILAAAQEERFTRQKHDSSFPSNAISYCLDYAGCTLDELDAVAFYDKPFLKFERLLETYYNFAPAGLISFVRAIPVWVKEKLFLKKRIREQLEALMPYDANRLPLLFPEHHLSHAASAFYASPYEEAAILTIDGVGEWATATIAHGQGRSIKVLRELHYPDSVGLLYSAVTYFLGFRVNSGEYKLMGLAPYGNLQSAQVQQFIEQIKSHLVDIKADGSIRLHPAYFSYNTTLRMVKREKWEALFGVTMRSPEGPLEQSHCNLALAFQQVTEEIVALMAKEASRLTGARHLCMAGGVALNCVSNGKLEKEKIFDQLYIQPAAGDAGGALGAALAAHYLYFKQERHQAAQYDHMQGAYLGPEYTGLEIEKTARRHQAPYSHLEDRVLFTKVAQLLDEGHAVGWFQGRMEYGPRALGNRSILGDPRNPEMQKKLNLKIKQRESFRPFAPAVLAEDLTQYFQLAQPSPYMLQVQEVAPSIRHPLPEGYAGFELREKLYYQRSALPAITHVDFSARIQTVHKETNPRFEALLQAFKALTGCGVLINTSFNVRGEPIVCTPEDAYQCFIRTDMDYLVMGNYLFDKKAQIAVEEIRAQQKQIVLD